MVLERLNFKQNGQVDLKKNPISRTSEKKGFTHYPRFIVVYKR